MAEAEQRRKQEEDAKQQKMKEQVGFKHEII